MVVCVAGWYTTDDILKVLEQINSKFKVTIVSHIDTVKIYPFEFIFIPNIGLEFGCYDYFIKNLWDKKSDVLFMHDDVRILDISVFEKIHSITTEVGIDQAYVFKNQEEQNNNGGKSGRAIFISKKLLDLMLSFQCTCHQSVDFTDKHNPNAVLKGTGTHCGFWFDPYNTGHTVGKPPEGVRHYNSAIEHFHRFLGWVRDNKLGNEPMNVLHRLHFSEFDCARRGEFRVERKK